jgi:hypothetical protein
MGRPSTLERWTADELASLEKMALKDPGKDAMEVARIFVEKHPTRTLDAAKQRVFKIRREQAGIPTKVKGVSGGAVAKAAPPPRQQVKPAVPEAAPEAPAAPASKVAATAVRTSAASAEPSPRIRQGLMTMRMPGNVEIEGTPQDVLMVLRELQGLARTA